MSGAPVPEPNPNPTPTPEPEPTPAPVPEPAKDGSILGDPATPATPTPEPFDPEKLTLPEGFNKEDETFAEFTNIAKEAGLTGPAAQKLIDLHTKSAKAAVEQLTSQWNQQNETWIQQVRADSEIGGDKLPGLLQTFAKVADNPELSDPEFRQALLFTGAGNHPAVIRTLSRWAKALSEGGSVQGGPPARNGQGQVVDAPPSLGTAIYGPDGPHSGGPKLS